MLGGLNCAAFAGGVVQAFLTATQFVSVFINNPVAMTMCVLTTASKGSDILAQTTQNCN